MTTDRRPPITHVAVRYGGKVYSLPKPNRHADVIRIIMQETDAVNVPPFEDQGFLDESGRFLSRRQALLVAMLGKQVLDPSKVRHNMLSSDDLW